MDKPLRLIIGIFIFFTSISFFGFQNTEPVTKEKGDGPNREVEYFKKWHGEDVGNMIPSERMKSIWEEINNMPSENSFNEAINTWAQIGPTSMYVTSTGARWSGRVLDLNIRTGDEYPRVAAASGGLWAFLYLSSLTSYSLSSQLSSLAIGSFDLKPGDNSVLIVGTGEPRQRTGTGVYRSVTGGTIFTKLNFPSGDPGAVYKVRYDLINTNVVYIATDRGFYKSIDGGNTWTNYLSAGNVTDFEVHPSDNSTLYAAVWGNGIFRSNDYGVTWTKLTTGGIPSTNVGRTDITIPKFSSNYIYVSMAKNDSNTTLGVYRSTNSGVNWVNVTPSNTFLGNQGWYDNIISVNPVNANIVLAGGVFLWRSTNGGANWTFVSDQDIHADQHTCLWKPDGSQVWVGHDGGVSTSLDAGATWTSYENILPITQYVNIDVGVSNTNLIMGGSQDNGISRTTNGGTTWNQVRPGDGGGIAIDPTNANNVFITDGVYDPNVMAFKRLKSTNTGLDWSFIDNGIDNSKQWYTKIRSDLVAPIYLYHNSGGFVYKSTNNGALWEKLNSSSFVFNVSNLNVSRFQSPGSVVYAALDSWNTGAMLRVFDGTSWNERSEGFTASVRGVKPHPSDVSKAYAVLNGFSAGNKVFKTTNKGVNWTNISGNLPNVPMGDVIPHPLTDNLIYVGTEMGCYKTTNAGVNWYRWNNGMPEASIVTEMVAIDSLSTRGRYYIIAATYGRSMFMREVSGDDPIGISTINSNIPASFSLKQNYPNPFNPVTNINFELPVKEFVNVKIFDISGKEIQTIVNENLNAGVYNYSFDGAALSSGVYFYRISAGKYSETKRMMLLK